MKPQHPLTAAFVRMRSSLIGLGRCAAGISPEQAADCVQEAFVRLWMRRDNIDPQSTEALAAVSVRNAAIDMRRRAQAHPCDDLDEARTVAAEASDDDRDAMLQQVMLVIGQRLSPVQRQVLLMRERDGCEMAEIADELHLTPANVRMILSRARRLVRDTYLEKYGQL